MGTYITLFKYTGKGIAEIEKAPARIEAGRKAYEALGGTLTSWHLTMGPYDGVIVGELPSDDAAAKLALSVGKLGNISTTTMRAWSDSEFKGLLEGLV